MIRKLVMLLFFLLLLVGSPIYAMTSSNIDKLNQKSDDLLQMVKIKREEEAKQALHSFSDQLLTLTSKDSLSKEEKHIMTAAYEEVSKTINNQDATYSEKVNKATKLRLVVDAVSSNYRPLWTEMEDTMMTTFSQAKQAAAEQNSQQFHEQLNDLLVQYDLIYYSLKIDIKPEMMQTVDAGFQYVDQYRPQLLENVSSQQELTDLQNDMKTIFDEMKKDEADPSIWWVIITTGSIIISTLSYVGWRKYKGTKTSVRSKTDFK